MGWSIRGNLDLDTVGGFLIRQASDPAGLSLDSSFRKQKPPQSSKIIQDSAALMHVRFEFAQAIQRNSERIGVAGLVRRGCSHDVRLELSLRFVDGLCQQLHELMSALDGPEWILAAGLHCAESPVRSRLRRQREH